MGVRFTSLHYSHAGSKYEVKILDEELGVSTNYDINWGDDSGVTFTRTGGTPLKPERIVSLSATLVLRIENTNDQDFYDDLKASYEGRFFMEVNWFHPLTDVLINIFKGHILSDLSAISDTYQPDFTITAVDGLKTLKNIDYYGDPVPNLQKTINKHVGRILNALPITTLYDSFQPFYKFAVDLRDKNHGVGAIFADHTRVRNYFYEKKDGVKVFKKMYDVLHEFLSMINGRIYFAEGVFWIDQLGYRGEYATINYDVYNTDRTYNSTTSSRPEINYMNEGDIDADAYPQITSIAPVKTVSVIQEGDFLANILLGKEWNKDDATAEITTGITEVNGVDRIFFNFDLYHYMESTRLSIIPNTTVRPVAWMKLNIEIKIIDGETTHYYGGLYKDIFYNNQHEYRIAINAIYSGTTPEVIRIIIPISRLPPANTNIKPDLKKIPVAITTPTLQHTGDVSVNISNMVLYENQTITTFLTLDPIYAVPPNTNETYWWEATNPVFTIGKDINDAISTNSRVTTLVNDVRNNIDIEEKFTMGVFNNSLSLQKLEVYDGANWVDSTGWKNATDTSYQRIAVQVIRDILKLRKLPSDLIEISWWDKTLIFHSYGRLINYKGRKCIWMDWNFTTQDDTIKGTLWELINSSVEDDPPILVSDIPGFIQGLPPGFTGEGDPPQSNAQGETNYVDDDLSEDYYYEGTMTGDSIVINYEQFPDTSVHSFLSINHSMKIHIGSDLYHIVDKAKVDLGVVECRLITSTKSIEFSKDLTGRLIRIEARNKYNIPSVPTSS